MLYQDIVSGQWKKIYDQVLKNPEILKEYIYNSLDNNVTLLDIAAEFGQKEIIQEALKYDPKLFTRINTDGNTPVHILARNGHDELLKFCLEKYPKWSELLNKNGTPVYGYVNNLFEWVIKTTKPNLNIINNFYTTELEYSVFASKEPGDVYDKKVDILIKYGADMTLPAQYPPIITAAVNLKYHIIPKLASAINTVDSTDKWNALIRVFHDKRISNESLLKIFKLLLDAGCNINYTGMYGDENLFILATKIKFNELIMLMLNYNPDLSLYNGHKRTPLHYAVASELLPSTITALLAHPSSDVNIVSLENDTPLSILIELDKWENYSEVLSTKKLNIYTPKIITPEKNTKLMNLVAKSYYNHSPEICKTVEMDKCHSYIIEHISKVKRSLPTEKDQHKLVKLIKNEHAYFGRFNAEYQTNTIYDIILLKKWKDLGISITPCTTKEDLYIKPETHIHAQIINNRIKTTINISCDFLTTWIAWSPHIFWHHPKLLNLIEKIKTRFVYVRLSIMFERTNHANIILLDKQKMTCERFEPYGNPSFFDTIDDKLDILIAKLFHSYKYYAPKDYLPMIGFQILSNDIDIYNLKLGDPQGYCLAWVYWYVEMRLSNPDIAPKELIQNAIENISNGKQSAFIDYIRNYAFDLNKQSTDYILNAGVPKEDMYAQYYSHKNLKLLNSAISKDLVTQYKKIY